MANRWGQWRLIVVGEQRFRWKVDSTGYFEIPSRSYVENGHTWEPDQLFIRPEDRSNRRVIVSWPACKAGCVTPRIVRRCLDEALNQGWLTEHDCITLNGLEFSTLEFT